MGGFDSYALAISMQFGRPILADESLSDLQAVLKDAAPEWSSRLRIARVGRWSQSKRIAMDDPRYLDSAIRGVLSGGSNDRATIGDEYPEPSIELTGTDRSVHLLLGLDESLRASRRWSGLTDQIVIEANKRTVGAEPAAVWIGRVFVALCEGLQPAVATASTLGERISSLKRYGEGTETLEWLTYFGESAASQIGIERIVTAPDEAGRQVGGGGLLTIGGDPGPGRTVRYWRRVDAVRDHLGAASVQGILSRRLETQAPTLLPQEVRTSGAKERARRGSLRLRTMTGTDTKSYVDMRIAGAGFSKGGVVKSGYRFQRCEFDNCSLGSDDQAAEPVTVRDCHLIRCKGRVIILRRVVFDDCVLDGWTGGAWPTDQVLLRHVVLRGNIDAIDIRDPRQLSRDAARIARHQTFYDDVEWALDISDARFRRADLSGVPGRLIRRDPRTQIVVTLDRLRTSRWQEVDFHETAWNVAFERMLEARLEDGVLVAEPRGKHYEAQLSLIDDLRRLGIAEPD